MVSQDELSKYAMFQHVAVTLNAVISGHDPKHERYVAFEIRDADGDPVQAVVAVADIVAIERTSRPLPEGWEWDTIGNAVSRNPKGDVATRVWMAGDSLKVRKNRCAMSGIDADIPLAVIDAVREAIHE